MLKELAVMLKTFVFVVLLTQQVRSDCLNNYNYKFQNEWESKGKWKANGVIKLNFEGTLKDWQLQIEFTAPLAEDIKVWDALGEVKTKGKTSIVLTPKYYNKVTNKDSFQLSYIATFAKRQGKNHLKCVQFCGTVIGADKSTKKLCSGNPVKTMTPIATESRPTAGIKACDNVFHYTSKWNEGFNGEFVIKVPADVSKWTVTFTTDEPFVSINPYDARLSSVPHYSYSFHNRDYNGYQKAGSILKLDFTAMHGINRRPNILSIVFKSLGIVNEKLCGFAVVLTTQRPTIVTKPSTTAATTTTTTTKKTSTKVATKATTKTVTIPVTTTTTTQKEPTKLPTEATTKTPASKPATTATPRPCIPKYNYSEVLEKSLLFYETQRSGKLPSNQRVKWRKDSALNDGSDAKVDLSGGYYDAGDYVKFGFPMASTITNLAWGMLEFKTGYDFLYQLKYGLEALKWGTDYFIKCHTSKFEFYGQVGDGQKDHAYWGRPEDMSMERPSYKIDKSKAGSELAGETAAALAASSLVFRDNRDTKYAEKLLRHAKELYTFATKYRKTYHLSIPDVAKYYKSFSGYTDELAWASLWLYRATNDIIYKDAYLKEFDDTTSNMDIEEFSWDNKWAGVKVLAAHLGITSKDYLSKFKVLLQSPKKTPKGLFFVTRWGSNRHAANLAFLALIAGKVKDSTFYRDFARGQIHYILGDAGHSYVVGFGKNPPLQPHHASSSCPLIGKCDWGNFNDPRPNPHILYGALVGGPDDKDQYRDIRGDYVNNEVTCDYNAGFQSAVAGLIELSQKGKC